MPTVAATSRPFAFWRGEPHEDVDSIFVATNLALLAIAFVGLTFFGTFFDIFASVGFVSLCFGFCRLYAGVQRGRAVGNADYRHEYDPQAHPWLAMARLRFVPDPKLDARAAKRRRREYRRRLRRFLYAGCDAVMIEGVVERKSWLHEILDDLMVLVWKGRDRADAERSQQHAVGQRPARDQVAGRWRLASLLGRDVVRRHGLPARLRRRIGGLLLSSA